MDLTKGHALVPDLQGGHECFVDSAWHCMGNFKVINQHRPSMTADPISAYNSPPHW